MNLSRLLLVPVWFAGMWGSLQVHKMDLNITHSICGRWGCGPPAEALIGYHGFWLFSVLPIAMVAGWYFTPRTSRTVGRSVLLLSLVATIAYVAWDVVDFYRQAESAQYLLQRGFFTLVTTVDVPMIPTILAGALLMFWYGTRTKTEAIEAATEPVSPFDPGAEPAAL